MYTRQSRASSGFSAKIQRVPGDCAKAPASGLVSQELPHLRYLGELLATVTWCFSLPLQPQAAANHTCPPCLSSMRH
jgi:hypothetical protein